MPPIFFKNAHIIDPSCQCDKMGNLLVIDGKIADIGSPTSLTSYPCGSQIIDCAGRLLCPGLVDMGVFVNSLSDKKGENLASLNQAALASGITSILLQPSKELPLDRKEIFDALKLYKEQLPIKIYPCIGAGKNLSENELSEYGFLRAKGGRAVSMGAQTIRDNRFLYQAMLHAKEFALPFLHEIQDPSLSAAGCAHDSLLANWLGLGGLMPEAELISLMRDLALAQRSEIDYHIKQISSKMALDFLYQYKDSALNPQSISAGVSVSHLLFNENDIANYNNSYYFAPPLRGEEDRQALINAIKTGLIDSLSSNHEPLSLEDKAQPFALSKPGSAHIECLFAASLRLYHNGDLSLLDLISLLSTKPANILKIEGGTLQKGAPCDLLIADIYEPWIFRPEAIYSKTKNNCFLGSYFQGRVHYSFINGQLAFSAPELA